MSDKLLTAPEALTIVRDLRANSARLRALRNRLTAQLNDSRCVIIGSAPSPVFPQPHPDDKYICVNGSPHVAAQFGVAKPELTIIAGYSTNPKNKIALANAAIWSGKATGEVIFVDAGDSEQHAREVLTSCGFHFDKFTTLSIYERAAIVGEVCGEELGLGRRNERISNGIFAAVVAIWANAGEVVLSGFSLGGGHSYIVEDTPRFHINGDRNFFAAAIRLSSQMRTTSRQLHEQTGIALVI